MSIMHSGANDAPPCPACGLPASRVSSRDLDGSLHELTGSCKRGHIWSTKWFAEGVR